MPIPVQPPLIAIEKPSPGPTLPPKPQEPKRPGIPDPAPDTPGPKPGTEPVPGTPSITPREVPSHPGEQPQPAREHPADPRPTKPMS